MPTTDILEVIKARIKELEEIHGSAESCGWHPTLKYYYDMEFAAAFNELKRILEIANEDM